MENEIKNGGEERGESLKARAECWRDTADAEKKLMEEVEEFKRYEEIVEMVKSGLMDRNVDALNKVLKGSGDLNRELVGKIVSERWAKKAEQVFREADGVMNRARLEKRLGELKIDRSKVSADVKSSRMINRKRISWLLRGIAAVLILGFGAWGSIELWKNEEVMVGKGIMAKGVVLRLEDGREIQLDTLRNGMRQGDAEIMKTNAKQLTYAGIFENEDVNETEGNADMLYNEVVVPRAGEFSLVLVDGTKVWMNAESKLRFPVKFKGKERRVVLEEGEAYFEVTKQNGQLPFIVETQDMEVKVLGTRFDVNVSRLDGVLEATLLEGKVAVRGRALGGEKNWIMLNPDEQARVENGNVHVRSVDAKGSIAWMDGLFRFERECLEEIAAQLERWYDIQVVFMREELKEKRFTGVVFRDETVDKALNMIRKTAGLQYYEGNGVVTIY